MSARKAAPVDEPVETVESEPEPEPEVVAALADAEPCQHPNANGVCWYSQIGDACGVECRWAMAGTPARR